MGQREMPAICKADNNIVEELDIIQQEKNKLLARKAERSRRSSFGGVRPPAMDELVSNNPKMNNVNHVAENVASLETAMNTMHVSQDHIEDEIVEKQEPVMMRGNAPSNRMQMGRSAVNSSTMSKMSSSILNETNDTTMMTMGSMMDGEDNSRGRSRSRNFMCPTASSRSKSRERVQAPIEKRSSSLGPQTRHLTEPVAPNLLTSVRHRQEVIPSSTTRELEEIKNQKQMLLEQRRKEEMKLQAMMHHTSANYTLPKKPTIPVSPDLTTQRRGHVVEAKEFKSAAEIATSFLNKNLRQDAPTSRDSFVKKPVASNASVSMTSGPSRVSSMVHSTVSVMQARSPGLSFIERARIAQEQREMKVKQLLEEKEKAELSMTNKFKAKPLPTSTFHSTSINSSFGSNTSMSTMRVTAPSRNIGETANTRTVTKVEGPRSGKKENISNQSRLSLGGVRSASKSRIGSRLEQGHSGPESNRTFSNSIIAQEMTNGHQENDEFQFRLV